MLVTSLRPRIVPHDRVSESILQANYWPDWLQHRAAFNITLTIFLRTSFFSVPNDNFILNTKGGKKIIGSVTKKERIGEQYWGPVNHKVKLQGKGKRIPSASSKLSIQLCKEGIQQSARTISSVPSRIHPCPFPCV